MTIIAAKQILLHTLVEHLGGRPAKRGRPHEAWYYSPFRPDEKTPSFKVNELTNRWHDFGHVSARTRKGSIGSGGDAIDLWCDYHNRDRQRGVKEALQALESLFDKAPRATFQKNAQDTKVEQSRFEIIKIHKKIFYLSLKEELNRRMISHATASLYLQQAFIRDNHNPAKKINGFSFKNDKGGYELSVPNPFNNTSFKTSTKPKYFTTIEGKDKDNAMVFEGFWDFLTWLEMNKLNKPPCTTYILNSVSFIHALIDTVTKQGSPIKFISLFLDNDNAGIKALNEFILELEEANTNIKCGDMSEQYKPHKDLNEFWINAVLQKLLFLSGNNQSTIQSDTKDNQQINKL